MELHGEYCDEHCLMKEHIKESPMIRSKVEKHDTKIDNYDIWIPKIEQKVDAIPAMLNGFYIKIMLSVGLVNIGTLITLSLVKA